jgi:hypothetical protein
MSEHVDLTQSQVKPPGPSPEDRRCEPRLPPRGGVDVTCRALPDGQDLALAILDVSASGARLLVRGTLTIGQEVEVCMYPVTIPAGFQKTGRIAWAASLPGGYFSVGVQFDTPLPPDACELLASPSEPPLSRGRSAPTIAYERGA